MLPRNSLHTNHVNSLQKRKFTVLPHQLFYFISMIILLLTSINTVLIFISYGLKYNSPAINSLLSLFYLDKEYNIPTYWTSLLLLSASLLLTYIFIQQYLLKEKYRYAWAVLAGIFLLMSMDEYMALHERMIEPLRSFFDAGSLFYFTWVIPAIIAVVITGLLFLRFFLSLRPPIRKMFFLAGIIYLGGVLGVEMFSGYVTHTYGQRSLHYPLTTTVEETLEMFGAAYFIYALLTYIQTDLGQKMYVTFKIKNAGKKIPPFSPDVPAKQKDDSAAKAHK